LIDRRTLRHSFFEQGRNLYFLDAKKCPSRSDLSQSHSQSLRSPWPAVGKRELWEQPFWNNWILVILPIRFHCAVCIYGACLKWLLPELSFSDRWSRGTKTLGTRLCFTMSCTRVHTCSKEVQVVRNPSHFTSVLHELKEKVICLNRAEPYSQSYSNIQDPDRVAFPIPWWANPSLLCVRKKKFPTEPQNSFQNEQNVWMSKILPHDSKS